MPRTVISSRPRCKSLPVVRVISSCRRVKKTAKEINRSMCPESLLSVCTTLLFFFSPVTAVWPIAPSLRLRAKIAPVAVQHKNFCCTECYTRCTKWAKKRPNERD